MVLDSLLSGSLLPRQSSREAEVSPALPARRFATTRWSLVVAAGGGASAQGRKALSELCALYWAPVHGFVRRQGYSEADAMDLTQGFFTRLLEKNTLAVADPARGRFRSWLLASVTHFMSNERDRQRTEKRGGKRPHVTGEDAEQQLLRQPATGPTPDRAFERQWAERLLAQALEALREEQARRGRTLLFDKLKASLVGVQRGEYARIAAELRMTEGAVTVEACRLRKRFAALLHQQVAHTVEKPEDVEGELRFLLAALEDV